MKIKLIAVGLVCIAIVSSMVISQVYAQTVQKDSLATITVSQGDTLWTIAQEHRGDTEIRKFIYNLQRLNGINSKIYPGQKLLLP